MYPQNEKKTMQIHNNTLIAECSSYDFKEMLERKKVKSWLKSVSAFANTDGGSLFYGVNDDGVIVGLENPQADANKHSFVILANTFREQTHQEWNDKYLESFGLVTSDGKLTNAGLLFVDNCTVFQSRIFCTRWIGLYKDDAISSVEHRANLVLLLKYGMDFIKNYTMSGWVKMPNYRLNLPDYSDRAIFEGLVNHLIHRDYTLMGGEVHIDIYDDRVELVSHGAMLDGTQIQDRDIYRVPSMRRNPVIADMFTQLDYMEKRGSGLRKMWELTEKLPNFLPGKEPQYQTEAISFYTTFYNLNWGENGRIPVEEVANRVNSTLEKYPVNEESSVKKFGVNEESSEKTFGDLQKSSVKIFGDLQNSSVKQKRLGRTAQSILDLVISDGSISQDKMAEKIGVSKRAIEMQIANLKAKGLLVREGAGHGGYWRIVINPKAEE